LTYKDSEDNYRGLGTWSDKQYDDLDGVEELTHLPDEAFHRDVDKIVLEAGTKHGDRVKTVIVCPPTIYGEEVLVAFVSRLTEGFRQRPWPR
jgi:hypothetical protein